MEETTFRITMEEGSPVNTTLRRLEGRTALVTGASRGIGAAVAHRYAAEGAAVAVGYQPTPEMEELALKVVEEITENGGQSVALASDLASTTGAQELVTAAREALGPLDIIVANAAFGGERQHFSTIPVEEWDRVFAVNVRATWLLVQAALPDLRESEHASVIALTSVMAALGKPLGAVHYVASKAGILGMVRALARELGPDGIRVNAIMPGAIRTEDEVERSPDSEAAADRIIPLQALERRGFADDLAGAFAFLASDDSSFITGQNICIDGGWVMY